MGLFKVTVAAGLVLPVTWSPKLIDAGHTKLGVLPPVLLVPVPLRDMTVGEVGALLVIVRLPVNDCAKSGANFTDRVTLAPGFRGNGKVGGDDNWNSEGVMLRPLIVRVALPVLVAVTDCDALVIPTVTLPNASEEGETVIIGPELGDTPVPLSETEVGEVDALLVMVKLPVNDCAESGLKVTARFVSAPGLRESGKVGGDDN